MRIGAQRELSRSNGQRFLMPGHGWLCPARRLVSPLQRYVSSQPSPLFVQGRRWFVVAWEDQREYMTTRTRTPDEVYLVRCLDDPGPIKLPISSVRYQMTLTGAVRYFWCLKVNLASTLARGGAA